MFKKYDPVYVYIDNEEYIGRVYQIGKYGYYILLISGNYVYAQNYQLKKINNYQKYYI